MLLSATCFPVKKKKGEKQEIFQVILNISMNSMRSSFRFAI